MGKKLHIIRSRVREGRDHWRVIYGPPGTGKTTTLVGEIQRRAASGWAGGARIAVVTFSRSAASELVARLGGDPTLWPWVRTLHSACAKLLGGIKPFNRKHYSAFNERFSRSLQEYVSHDDDDDPSADSEDDALLAEYDAIRLSGHAVARDRTSKLGLFVHEYELFKREHGLSDYTDCLTKVLEQQLCPPTRYLYVDEAQDLSPLQQAIIEMWGDSHAEVTIAGDDDQAIYAFQGADSSWLVGLSTSGADTRVLDRSYRLPSVPHAEANALIAGSTQRVPKRYSPVRHGGQVSHVAFDEALDLIDQGELTFWLVRTRRQTAHVASELLRRGIPYRIRAGRGMCLYRHQALQAALRASGAVLASTLIPTTDLLRMLSYVPSRGFLRHGFKTDVERSGQGTYSVDELVELGGGALVAAIKAHGVTGCLMRGVTDDELDGLRTVLNEDGTLRDPCVILGTVHSAKGLEADHVIVDTRLGTYFGRTMDYESELRVAYVAATRTKDRLTWITRDWPHDGTSTTYRMPGVDAW